MYSRYSNFDRLIPGILRELQNLSKPSSIEDKKYSDNMSRIQTKMIILDQEGETSRLEYIVVENMVGNAFPKEASNKY